MRPLLPKSRLFRKYVVFLVLLIGGLLLASGAFELYFSYQQAQREVVRLEREKALAAAERIESFVREIEQQLRATTHAGSDDPAIVPGRRKGIGFRDTLAGALLEQRELDFLRFLRSVPAAKDVRHLDIAGRELIRVSRFALDAMGSGEDFSRSPAFIAAKTGKTYFSPVYFYNDSEPRMTIAVPSGEYAVEVTVAEVSLKAIWDVVSRIRVGRLGHAYVVDARGHLIAHPDVSLALQKRNVSDLEQVRAARAESAEPKSDVEHAMVAKGLDGTQVLAAHAAINPLGWLVFVEQPLAEAFAPLQAAIARGAVILIVGLGVAVLGSVVLARHMVSPINALQASAARIGAGELGHRIELRTADELEALANEFNRTAARLQESYAGLEEKVARRTRQLTQAVQELKALSEIGQAVSSTLDMDTVLRTIITHAVGLATADAGGTIYEFDEAAGVFRPRANHGISAEMVQSLSDSRIRLGDTALGECAVRRAPVQIADIAHGPEYRLRDFHLSREVRALLAVPLLREERIVGGLVVRRKQAGEFAPSIVSALQMLAAQSALAIENARLFNDIRTKSQQLELASRHKSDFLSSMSHELRTPLNAILGFNEMILGQVYGEVPLELKEPLSDMQQSGKHLLRLINNVLDLAKIEAGRMELALASYPVQVVIESVRSTLRPLAADKGLEFNAEIPADLPLVYGDSGRITQCLMNLAGNAIKFTKSGGVSIGVERQGEKLVFRVSDTGIGIPPDKIGSLFTEFKQTDATIATEYGGTGLGLSLTRKFIELHGGSVWVESEPGKGSTFLFEVPLRASAGGTA